MKENITPPTIPAVRAAIGSTWFSINEEDDQIILDTREHGDVCEERAGDPDIREGKRILAAIRSTWPAADWKSEVEVVDEWVHVQLRIAPFDAKELAERDSKRRFNELRATLEAVIKEANNAACATVKNSGRPFSGCVTDFSSKKASLSVRFGTRILYRNHLGAEFVFSTLAEAEAAIQPVLAKLPPMPWKRTVSNEHENRTGNYPPPNNIIERETRIEFTAPIS